MGCTRLLFKEYKSYTVERYIANKGFEHFSTLVAVVTKLACFFIRVSDPAELAIYIDIQVISLAQTVLRSDMKKHRSLSVEDKSL